MAYHLFTVELPAGYPTIIGALADLECRLEIEIDGDGEPRMAGVEVCATRWNVRENAFVNVWCRTNELRSNGYRLGNSIADLIVEKADIEWHGDCSDAIEAAHIEHTEAYDDACHSEAA